MATKKPAAKTAVAPKPQGRPSKYTPEIGKEICERIAVGTPLREICREDGMPHWTTVYDWIASDEDFSLRIAHARKLGYDAIAAECLEIADNATNDWMESISEDDGGVAYKLNGEHIQRSKLRIETRLKLLSKWDSKRYGDKVENVVTGADGGPIDHSITVTFK